MFNEYGVTEIDCPDFSLGEATPAMWGIVKSSRRRGKSGQSTEGVASAAPYSLNML